MKFYLLILLVSFYCAQTHTYEPSEEEKFVNYYKNALESKRGWDTLRNLYFMDETGQMKMICSKIHHLAGIGAVNPENLMIGMNIRVLNFKNSSHVPLQLDVLWYVNFENETTSGSEMKYYFITAGRGADCVYYLTPTDASRREFYLDRHICGIPKSLFSENKLRKRTEKFKAVHI